MNKHTPIQIAICAHNDHERLKMFLDLSEKTKWSGFLPNGHDGIFSSFTGVSYWHIAEAESIAQNIRLIGRRLPKEILKIQLQDSFRGSISPPADPILWDALLDVSAENDFAGLIGEKGDLAPLFSLLDNTYVAIDPNVLEPRSGFNHISTEYVEGKNQIFKRLAKLISNHHEEIKWPATVTPEFSKMFHYLVHKVSASQFGPRDEAMIALEKLVSTIPNNDIRRSLLNIDDRDFVSRQMLLHFEGHVGPERVDGDVFAKDLYLKIGNDMNWEGCDFVLKNSEVNDLSLMFWKETLPANVFADAVNLFLKDKACYESRPIIDFFLKSECVGILPSEVMNDYFILDKERLTTGSMAYKSLLNLLNYYDRNPTQEKTKELQKLIPFL